MRYLRIAAGIAGIEMLAIVVQVIAIAIAALHSHGSTETATLVLIAIYLIFALGMAFLIRGLLRDSKAARAPYFLVQLFGLVVAFTLLVGDGAAVKIAGVIVGGLSVAGLAIMVTAVIKMPDEPLRPKKRVDADKSS